MENAYMEEKEDACNALGEIATNVGCVYVCCVGGRTMKAVVLTIQFWSQ